jgi:hypothetical protein
MEIKKYNSADNDLEIEKIGIVNKDNQFMILNPKIQKNQKDLPRYKKGLRILDLNDFKFIEIN